ncbi:proline-rich protein 2 [Syzygium oleosum]|uniref:proline-rich protein 2 n=1 Tax=Syzygium oleosum TaxID=219896 RepID=UPI0024B91DE8|nr:proline-rich protein 2 [Syzygium oleosum]
MNVIKEDLVDSQVDEHVIYTPRTLLREGQVTVRAEFCSVPRLILVLSRDQLLDKTITMSWFLIAFLFLSFAFSFSEATQEKKLPSTVVVGTVYCDTCFMQRFSKASHFIPGASVVVECKDGGAKPSFRKEAKTDEHGEFKVYLPFSVGKHVRRIKGCSVKLSSSEPNCAVASAVTSSSLDFKMRKDGDQVFSAGFFTFKPRQRPNLCSKKPSSEFGSEKILKFPAPSYDPTFPPPLKDPATPDLPTVINPVPSIPLLPQLPPLLQLPPLPPLLGLPQLPPIFGTSSNTKPGDDSSKPVPSLDQEKSPPELFVASNLTANPFQPDPVLPPNPLQPPSEHVIPLPQIPGLLTPAPSFPAPLPQIPIQPSPGLPGFPPASSLPTKTTP